MESDGMGSFGIDDASELTWNFLAGLGFQAVAKSLLHARIQGL